MVMTTLYQHLNLPLPLFKDEHDEKKMFDIITEKRQKYLGDVTTLSKNDIESLYHTQMDMNLINPDLRKLLLKLNIHLPTLFEVFYSLPNYSGPIHVDDYHGDLTKLNWQYFGNNSNMNWYSTINEPKTNEDSSDIEVPSAVYYAPDEVTLIDSVGIQSPTIVQVGLPHNSVNSDQERYLISLTPIIIENNVMRRIPMNEILEIFKDYIA